MLLDHHQLFPISCSICGIEKGCICLNGTIKTVQSQLDFIEWLMEKGLYNPMDSANTMQKMQAVWEESKGGLNGR